MVRDVITVLQPHDIRSVMSACGDPSHVLLTDILILSDLSLSQGLEDHKFVTFPSSPGRGKMSVTHRHRRGRWRSPMPV